MKTLRRMSGATILSLILAVSAVAGDIHCPGIVSTGTGTTNAESTDTTTTVILTVINLLL